jgi:lysophospholipase L1-like esterase
MHKRAQFRRILINIILVMSSLALCALFLEASLRVYADLLFPKMMVLDDKLGWRHTKNVKKIFQNEFGEKILVVADEYGHRGIGHPQRRVPGRFRILALGDSFTEGVQVGEADVFTAQMEDADPHLEVVNAGVGGYGTVQEYLYLTREGIQFRPDLVLLMFFGNDLTDNLLRYYPGFGPRPYANVTNEGVQVVETLDSSDYEKYILPAPFRMALNAHSYLYYFANSRLYQPLFATRMRKMQQDDLNRIAAETRFKTFFALTKEFNDFLEARKIPFVLVVIPTREEVVAGFSDVSNTIIQFCRTESINCLPLIDRFRREPESGSLLYFREDMHWTKNGHRVAASEILTYLRSVIQQTSSSETGVSQQHHAGTNNEVH